MAHITPSNKSDRKTENLMLSSKSNQVCDKILSTFIACSIPVITSDNNKITTYTCAIVWSQMSCWQSQKLHQISFCSKPHILRRSHIWKVFCQIAYTDSDGIDGYGKNSEEKTFVTFRAIFQMLRLIDAFISWLA